jgi:hypothetical protein
MTFEGSVATDECWWSRENWDCQVCTPRAYESGRKQQKRNNEKASTKKRKCRHRGLFLQGNKISPPIEQELFTQQADEKIEKNNLKRHFRRPNDFFLGSKAEEIFEEAPKHRERTLQLEQPKTT